MHLCRDRSDRRKDYNEISSRAVSRLFSSLPLRRARKDSTLFVVLGQSAGNIIVLSAFNRLLQVCQFKLQTSPPSPFGRQHWQTATGIIILPLLCLQTFPWPRIPWRYYYLQQEIPFNSNSSPQRPYKHTLQSFNSAWGIYGTRNNDISTTSEY